ncbi:hypothetical protein [Shewanella surugensis]|uniref:Uncharacterized protein n=1 Tax=Shewanella surugensis TaxID=212020 RepID=A0ABT0LIP5_9GAMM|nr:hypothetical protein [Shewanella surugensis]MCL1127240.1 hypothetical protein [Shewanella surugensis]
MIEAREISDFYNLLSYPIVRYAGGIIVVRKGENLSNQVILPNAVYDFIASTNKPLLKEIIHTLDTFKQKKEHKTQRTVFTLLDK